MSNIEAVKPKAVIATTGGRPQPLLPQDFESMYRMARVFASSGMLPKAYTDGAGADKEAVANKVFTAMQFGAEVGLMPLQACQNIAVINGNPCLWGDAQLALVMSSGLLEDKSETITGKDADMVATCTVKRVGQSAHTTTFSWQDAIKAGKAGSATYKAYPKRMLQLRARAFALRDVFPDVLKGLRYTAEELQDGVVPDQGIVIDVEPTQAQEAAKLPSKTKEAGESKLDAFVNEETGEVTQAELLEQKGTAHA